MIPPLLLLSLPLLVAAVVIPLLRSNRRLARTVAQREEAERALRLSEERWNFALEGARDAVWDWDIATNAVFFSKRWGTMLGYAEGELPARFEEWTKRIHPDDLDAALDAIQQHLRGETPDYAVEHRVEARDGSHRWILARGRVVQRSEAGHPLRMVGTHSDVTGRKISEIALQNAKQLAEDLIETANAIVIGLDPAGNVTLFNRTAEEITGFAKEEMIGYNVWEVLVPRSRFPEVVARIGPASPGLPKHNENPILTRSGEVRYIMWQNGVHRNGGKVIGSLSFGIDITERRRMEEELRNHDEQLEEIILTRTHELQVAEQRLRDVTDRLPGAVYQFVMKLDGSFGFAYCSEGFAKMTGSTVEEALQDVNSVWSKFPAEDVAELDRRARHSAETLTRYSQDLRVCLPGAPIRWIRAESVPQRQPDGTTLWNGNIMDITERKQLEEELAIAKAAAEAANLAKSTFLANMSHEIRTPMNAVLGFSRLMLRDGAITGLQRQNLETIHQSGEHLLSLINDILEMSKIEAGRVELRPSTFDLHALLSEIEHLFLARARERRLQFSVERAANLPRFIEADEAKLRQIFLNLIGNSVKFTVRGSVIARVTVAQFNHAGVRLQAEVSDTGPGIAAEDLPRLFHQFEQTDLGRHVGGGTGLGLSISREFVRLMGGDIHVTSEVGHGSTFCFDFRVGLAESAASELRPDERRVVRVLSGAEPPRVLIADDNPQNGELLQQMLQAVGFETRTALDGEAALGAFASWHPRVVLMDLRMPGLDGHEAIRHIRRMEGGPQATLIAVSASVFEEDRRQVFAAGGDDFLSKPVIEAELFAKLKQHTGLEYEYASEPTALPESAPASPMTPARVAAELSAELRGDLRQATKAADFDRILVLLDRATPPSPAVVAELRRRVEGYDYEGLRDLLAAE